MLENLCAKQHLLLVEVKHTEECLNIFDLLFAIALVYRVEVPANDERPDQPIVIIKSNLLIDNFHALIL